jgi:hypothetical protein
MALKIQRGKVIKAQKIVLYGPEGVGKTTFAAQFPEPLFIDTEGGTEHYDVARISPAPKSWNELMTTVDAVKREKPCKTLVIDTADWAENLCSLHVCSINSYKSIEDPGYGAGYTKLREEFGKLLDKLSDVAEAGIHVVVTAHAMMRKFDQPDEMASYDRWELKLQKKVAAIVKEWADAILFANYKTIVTTVDKGMGQSQGKAQGQKRVMYCQHHACWDAKNRWGLPDQVPFEHAQIAQFITCQAVEKPEPMQVAATPVVPKPTQAPVPTAVPTPIPVQPATQPKPIQSIVYAKDGTVISNTASAPAPALPDYFTPLVQLMEQAGVSREDVVDVCIKKGYVTADTPFASYAKDFVEGCLISAWPQVLAAINDNVPFN